jgi:hypothetical protein
MAMGAASSDGGASPILQYGVSEELSGLIEGLRQASSAVRRGEKYLPQSVNHVSRWLLCRDYQGPTLQLSYLLYAVLHARLSAALARGADQICCAFSGSRRRLARTAFWQRCPNPGATVLSP